MATISRLFMHREDYAGAHDCLEGVRETMEPGDPGRSCRQRWGNQEVERI